MTYLVVGLGNVGPEYSYTRHNVGFMVVDAIANQQEKVFSTVRLGYITTIKHQKSTIYLLKPSTYMNLSGRAVQYWLQQLTIPQEKLLVVTDDIHLPLGELRLRHKGSSGGHNGLKNIQERLGNIQFPRLRFGVGKKFLPGKQAEYVLARFTQAEHPMLRDSLALAVNKVLTFCAETH